MTATSTDGAASERVRITHNSGRTQIVLTPAPVGERLRQVSWIGPMLTGIFIGLTCWGPLFGWLVYTTGEKEAASELAIVASSLIPILMISVASVVAVMARRSGKIVTIELGEAGRFSVHRGESGARGKPYLHGEGRDLVFRAFPSKTGEGQKVRIRCREDAERGIWLYALAEGQVEALRNALLAGGVELGAGAEAV